MTGREASQPINSAKDLLDIGIELQGVQFFRIEASVKEDDYEPTPLPAELEPVYGLKTRHVDREIAARLSVRLDQPSWQIIVDAAVVYTTEEPIEFSESVLLDFANRIGVMALVPFLRQAIADVSQRVLGEVILMPMMKPGELSFGPDDEVAATD